MTATTTQTMNGAAPSTPPATPLRQPKGGVSARGVLRSEWVKLRSVRSSISSLFGAAAALFVIGVAISGSVGGVFSDGADDGVDIASAPLQGVTLAQLVIAVLGALVITSEYATGLIRSTLTAVPARTPVLAAKATILTVVVLPTMLVAAFATFLAGQAVIGTGDLDPASLSDTGVLRAVAGTGVFLTGVALFGLALGTLLRGTAAAISAVFGILFLLPGLGTLLPESSRD